MVYSNGVVVEFCTVHLPDETITQRSEKVLGILGLQLVFKEL
jgi:hypothetical protein